jgi:uncharacterized protein
MEQRVSLITLGVADVERARTFYERLGWTPTLVLDDVVFFQSGGSVVSLWGRDQLPRTRASTIQAGGAA